MWRVTFPEQPLFVAEERARGALLSTVNFRPNAPLFASLFPFHMLLDTDLNFLQFGSSLKQNMPSLEVGCNVVQFIKITVPYSTWSYEGIHQLFQSCCILTTKTGLELKGGFDITHLDDGREVILFTGSARVQDLEGLEVREYSCTVASLSLFVTHAHSLYPPNDSDSRCSSQTSHRTT